MITKEDVEKWVVELNALSTAQLTASEKKEQQKYATLIAEPKDKIFMSKMLDQTCQIRQQNQLALRVKILLDEYGVPSFFAPSDRFLLQMYRWVGYRFAWVAVPIIKARLRLDTAGIIIDEQRPPLTRHLAERYKAGIGQNVNLLGEVVVGNAEADHRYHHYLEALEQPDINYISVKISGIYAQLHPLNFAHSRRELIRRMATLYQKAIDFPYIDSQGVHSPKFINLDMEEYKDAHLTLDVFMSTLSHPEFKNLTAGIAVQAYLPDAWHLQSELLKFAHERVATGGAPLKMRLVKGANLQMETVISSLKGWPNPVRETKTEVDANYLHILDRALLVENAAVLNVGIASHNLYSIAYAHLLSVQNGCQDDVTFEMLEGMAPHLWRAMSKLGKRVILYTPVVSEANFLNAVSYLVRRLDENTGKENFLSYSFNLRPDTREWAFLQKQFEVAYELKDKVSSEVKRIQDRNAPYQDKFPTVFVNEPDTNFDLKANQDWALGIVERWRFTADHTPILIPTQIGAEQIINDKRRQYVDRCQEGVYPYEMSMATADQVDQVLSIAQADPSAWRESTVAYRRDVLHRAANLLAARRGDLIGSMCATTAKTITEGDVEVSEAIDFTRFYPLSMERFAALNSVTLTPKGTILVLSPWNFPLAIPVGGVAAALSGGNTVILKPSTLAAPVAWEAAKCFWDAGVPREALQVIITDGREPLDRLTGSPVIKHIIMTGGTDTAQRISIQHPTTPLSAETGGKNAMILTQSGDRDKAILNVVASAFGNAGQKCSACSLFLVDKDIYDDPDFASKLKDATHSVPTGSVWQIGHIVGPMISGENDKLTHAIEHLEDGESWLVAPEWKDEYTLRPTVKWGVEPTSYTFRTELFAPLLSVVSIDSLEEGIDLVNSLDYGLTSGLQSLDEQQQKLWRDNIMAGNLYINRGITGAIVSRQPFGGMKLSAFGGGLKAGGVNYVSCFVNATPSGANQHENYAEVFRREFSEPRDVSNIYGEQNILRYLPLGSMVLRVFAQDRLEDIKLVAQAAITCHTPLVISADETSKLSEQLGMLGCDVRMESFESFIRSLGDYERIRTLSADIPIELYRAASVLCRYIVTAPVVCQGRLELLHYLREQTITNEYHRYGSITEFPKIG
ncbi:MAG: bifunctional proline dehydrogenase/L-glutamate gamma-semialdehyde dehydrogenase [Mucinivorans sp.]